MEYQSLEKWPSRCELRGVIMKTCLHKLTFLGHPLYYLVNSGGGLFITSQKTQILPDGQPEGFGPRHSLSPREPGVLQGRVWQKSPTCIANIAKEFQYATDPANKSPKTSQLPATQCMKKIFRVACASSGRRGPCQAM